MTADLPVSASTNEDDPGQIGEPGSVVIAGGGVAALECLMALRDLGLVGLRIRLVAPSDAFVYRPLEVAEPFSLGAPQRYSLSRIAADFGAELVTDAIAEVRGQERQTICASGATLDYDVLVLAPGARPEPAFEHAITFGQDRAHAALHGLLADLEQGYAKNVTFVVPPNTSWSLPLYELALMTAREVAAQGIDDVHLSLVTPEPRPLAIFGPPVSDVVRRLLDVAGVEFVGAAYADVRKGRVHVKPSGRTIEIDRAVALPALRGPAIRGVPSDDAGFIPTDAFGAVPGLAGVYAAGDATTLPVKQGGLAAQQADAVAESIAARLGAQLVPRPFKPVLRGLLFTGDEDRFLRTGIGGGEGEGTAAVGALWWPPTKVAGRYLAPYLYPHRPTPQPAGFTEVAVPLGPTRPPGD
jgi:sulfide:quinone oxidoreductase